MNQEDHANGTRARRAWQAQEDSLLMKLYENGGTHEEIAAVMGRTTYGVQTRISVLGLSARGKRRRRSFASSGKPTLVDIQPEPVAAPAPPSVVEGDLALVLEFVSLAWREGHVIAIPALGATFRKGTA